MDMEQEREHFSHWIATAMPFDADVGMVEHSIKTDAAWQGWMARAASDAFQEALRRDEHTHWSRHQKLPPAEAAQPVAGWQWVPKEPTQEMHDAARAAMANGSVPMPTVYRAMLAAAPQPAEAAPRSKAERVHTLVNAGCYPGMSEAFDAHMGAACWTDSDYRPDAATWAAAWKAAKAHGA